MNELLDIMDRLRSEGGCPWDREQTLDSLKQYLIEECYELIDAIDSNDPERHVDELGDVLLQVVFQARIRKEEGAFTFDDVVDTIKAKLIRRHPHVFGDSSAKDSAEVLKHWERIKKEEKGGDESQSVLRDVPRHLPALVKAQRVQIRAARVGFDWDNVEDVVAKIEEELEEVKEALAGGDPRRIQDEIGDLLFATVNLSRYRDFNAEETLNTAVKRFVTRFKGVEARVDAEGRTMAECSLGELEAHWQEVKKGQ